MIVIKYDFLKNIFVVRGNPFSEMPSDVVSMVTTGLGVSVLAGILSGVCYVLVHRGIGVGRKRTRKPSNEWYCEICGTHLSKVAELVEGKLVTCTKCQLRICKEKCSSFINIVGWTCQNCLSSSDPWFRGMLGDVKSHGLLNTNTMTSLQVGPVESERKLEKEQVRDFIEKLVNVMLGENVDSASVSKLYSDTQYLPIAGQSPSTAHTALKRHINNLLKEAVTLPQLEKPQHSPTSLEEDNSANRTYEDLLATAIINKVVTSCQNNLPSSSTHSDSGRISSSSRQHRDDTKEYFFGEETLDSKWKSTDLETTSVSSLEEWMTKSDSSLGSKKYVDRFTLTIKQNIEETDNFESDNEQDENNLEDPECFRTNSSLLSYHEADANWFLQRRHFQGTPSPVPVPMLVPNPTNEAKVLIGDKPVDDTSDLSDIGSEDFDYQPELPLSRTHALLVESKTVIGGKSTINLADDSSELHNGEEYEQSESSTDSGVKEVNGENERRYDRIKRDGKLENKWQSKADISVDDDNVEDSSYLSIYSNTEKEAEYIEKFGSLPRTIMKTPPLRPSRQKDKCKETAVLDERNASDDEEVKFVGNYSKKEKEKWNHAVEMKHNPYSKENIEKRIQRSSSSVSSMFGPDYYARQAKSPSGAKAKSAEVSLDRHVTRLEELSTYSSLPRSLYASKDASQNFVKNPLLNFPETENVL